MNKRVATTVVSAAVAAGMVFGLTGCSDKPPADFAKACKQAGGKTMRENDFENLGMAPMAFVAGKPKPKKSKSKKVGKAPKNNGWKLAGGSHKSKKKKSKKHDDNEWVCVKNGQELFEQD